MFTCNIITALLKCHRQKQDKNKKNNVQQKAILYGYSEWWLNLNYNWSMFYLQPLIIRKNFDGGYELSSFLPAYATDTGCEIHCHFTSTLRMHNDTVNNWPCMGQCIVWG